MFYQTDENHGLPHDPFKSCIVPRPIAWVSSIDPEGRVNLAPYSFFNGIAADPPLVMISFNGLHRDGGDKDTLANIRATGEFVVNMVPLALKDEMNLSCGDHPHEVDEMALTGLEAAPSKLVAPPRLAAAPINMECRLHQVVDLPCTLADSRNTMIIARVLGIHIDDAVLVDGLVDLTRIEPLTRLGYMQYSAIDSVFTMLRPKV